VSGTQEGVGDSRGCWGLGGNAKWSCLGAAACLCDILCFLCGLFVAFLLHTTRQRRPSFPLTVAARKQACERVFLWNGKHLARREDQSGSGAPGALLNRRAAAAAAASAAKQHQKQPNSIRKVDEAQQSHTPKINSKATQQRVYAKATQRKSSSEAAQQRAAAAQQQQQQQQQQPQQEEGGSRKVESAQQNRTSERAAAKEQQRSHTARSRSSSRSRRSSSSSSCSKKREEAEKWMAHSKTAHPKE
jgi:hypothetical protein